ncbi:hypothetical protein GEMRC1_006895 [Eukaryota sp. GEM-RC1]
MFDTGQFSRVLNVFDFKNFETNDWYSKLTEGFPPRFREAVCDHQHDFRAEVVNYKKHFESKVDQRLHPSIINSDALLQLIIVIYKIVVKYFVLTKLHTRQSDVPGITLIVFLPGSFEVESLVKACYHNNDLPMNCCYPLYSEISREDQLKAASKCKNNEFKIVAATNIAESSITIDSAVIVLDTGLERVPNFRKELVMANISQCSATQRAGRVGRTRPGICIRLFDFNFIGQYSRSPTKDPQILDSPLEDCILKVKQISSHPNDFLNAMPTIVSDFSVNETVYSLYLNNILESRFINDKLTSMGLLGSLLADSHEHFHFVFNCFVQDQVVAGLILLCSFNFNLFNFKFNTEYINQVEKLGNFLNLYDDGTDHGFSDLNMMFKFLCALLSGTINWKILQYFDLRKLKFWCDRLLSKLSVIKRSVSSMGETFQSKLNRLSKTFDSLEAKAKQVQSLLQGYKMAHTGHKHEKERKQDLNQKNGVILRINLFIKHLFHLISIFHN